jgi:DNA phosphorothioation-dependent restriction protein DptH
MNLFVDSVNKYLTTQCDTILEEASGKEVRIFLQSLPPSIAQQIFAYIEERYYSATLQIHLKIAKGLWEEWGRKYPDLQGQLSQIEKKGWVDLEDKLTHYRNMSCPTDKSGLIVMIIGLDHATDKGGLSDFHVVRENTIWNQQLKCSYGAWIEQLISWSGLPAGATVVNSLEKFFTTLFQHRHRSLVDLSDFLEKKLYPSTSSINTAGDLVALAYEKLPFWRIPPLLDVPNVERQGQSLLHDAATFISHQSFQNLADRKKAKEKIDQAYENGVFPEVPETRGFTGIYCNVEEFISTVKSFINDNDMEAKNKLLKTDVTKLLQVLKTRVKKTADPTEKPLKYQGPVPGRRAAGNMGCSGGVQKGLRIVLGPFLDKFHRCDAAQVQTQLKGG